MKGLSCDRIIWAKPETRTNWPPDSLQYIVGELRALPVGRGKIGRVKYLEVGRAVGRDRGPAIPASVIKNGVKLPQVGHGTILQEDEEKVGSEMWWTELVNTWHIQPSLLQMRQELEQINSNIAENPFMKNDMKKKDNSGTETAVEKETHPDNSSPELEREVKSVQKDDLKKELTQVLKELRKSDDEYEEGRLSKVWFLNSVLRTFQSYISEFFWVWFNGLCGGRWVWSDLAQVI